MDNPEFEAAGGVGEQLSKDSEKIAIIALYYYSIPYIFYFSILCEKCSPVPP